MVHVLEKDVQSTKTNVESMNDLMSKWSLASLYDRKDGKKDTLLNVEVFYRFMIKKQKTIGMFFGHNNNRILCFVAIFFLNVLGSY